MPQRKRFIAGAVCPSCQLPDKIYVLGEGLDAVRCCNQCGFEERMADVPDPAETNSQVSANEVQPIKMPGQD